MAHYIKYINLNADTIEYLKQCISENAARPIEDNISMSEVNHNATSAATYSPERLGDTSFDFLKDIITKEVVDSVGTDPNLFPFRWWVMKYKGNDRTLVHNHRHAKWVAVYYIDTPKGSGDLILADENITITPETGMLVIHRGEENHYVKKNKYDHIERYNMVINYR